MNIAAAETTAASVRPSRARRLVFPAVASAAVVSATIYTAAGDPYSPGHFPGCMWLGLTGFWCPGCGGLRAVHELAHGDVAAAFALNPLVVVLILPAIAIGLMLWWRSAWRGTAFPSIPMSAAIGVPIGLGVYWVARNIPAWEPFLAP